MRPDLKDRTLDRWKINFLSRWKTKLAAGNAKGLAGKRVSEDTLAQCKQWVQELPDYAAKYGLSMVNMINVDETPLHTSVGSRPVSVINSTRRPKFPQVRREGDEAGELGPVRRHAG